MQIPSSIKACIFDMDGVLVDTANYHYQSWRKLTDQWGFEFTQDANEDLKGASRMKSLEIILDKFKISKSPQEKEELCRLKNEWYVESIKNMTSDDILPGIGAFIEQAKTMGLKIGLGSASRNAKTVLQLIELDDQFDASVDGNDVTRGKPDPQVFLLGAKRMNVPAHACVVIEDAAKGIEAAKTAGMKTIGIGDKKNLHRADLVFADTGSLDWKHILDVLEV